MVLFEISALAGGQIGARFRDGMERVKSDAGAEFIDVGGVGKSPGTNAAVAVVQNDSSGAQKIAVAIGNSPSTSAVLEPGGAWRIDVP